MIFSVQNGCFSYTKKKKFSEKKEIPLLNNINLTITDGEILSILGANGAGKTTLVKCLLGLLQWDEGESLLDYRNIKEYSQKDFWSQAAYVPQAKLNSFVYTVEEMVLLGRSPRLGPLEQPKQIDFEIAGECLDTLGIYPLKDKLCSEISGGEYQLTLIARALACQPKLLILDEPEANLDFHNQSIVMNAIENLRNRQNISFIINTHFPEHAISCSDKSIVLLPEGRYLFGDTDETVTEKVLSEAFNINLHMEKINYNSRTHTCIFEA